VFHEPCHQGNSSRKQDPAVANFYSAAEHRSRGALWPSFALARIDGVKFKATDRKYASDDKRATYSFDIASAYPAEAGVKSWIRTMTLDRMQNRITVEENFELTKAVPVTLTVMTPRVATVEAAGSILLKLASGEGTVSRLKYDGETLEPTVETKVLDDAGLRMSWGSQVYRILLNSKQPVASGKWSYEFARA